MRLCPSVEGSASPLITHRIGVDVCLARQDTFFHKCHRCVYRGMPANWEPEQPPLATVDITLEPVQAATGGAGKVVALPRPVAQPTVPVAQAKSSQAGAPQPKSPQDAPTPVGVGHEA